MSLNTTSIPAAGIVTLAILSTWALAALVLTGLGLLIRRLFSIHWIDSDDLFRCFLLGYCFTLWFAEAYNIFFPIDWRPATLLGLLAAIGVASSWRSLRQWLSSALHRSSWSFALLLLVITAWVANHATGYLASFDDGNYHLTLVRWASEYPTVRGLGNLDGHFAFNNATLLFQAIFEIGWWKFRSSHIANGLIIVITLTFFLIKTRRAVREGNRASPMGIVAAIALTPLVGLVVGGGVASSATDCPSDVLFLAAAWMVVEYLPSSSRTSRSDGFHLAVLVTVLTSLPCIKMSSAVFSLVALPLLAVSWLLRREIPWRQRCRVALSCAAWSLVVAATWISHTVLLSGYPFFPATQFGLPVPWRIPLVYAEWSSWFIRAWGRAPYSNHLGNGWSWIPIWLLKEWRFEKIDGWLLPLISAGLFAYVLANRKRVTGIFRWSPASCLVVIPPLVAIPAWFFNAPLFRFASGLLWYCAALLAATALGIFLRQNAKMASKVVIVAGLLPFVSLGFGFHRFGSRALFVSPGTDHGLVPVPSNPLLKTTSRYGVSIYTPNPAACAQQALQCVVWDGPLPAAPHPKDTLAYLKPGEMPAGFQILEPSTPWPVENAMAVAAKARQGKMSERELAIYFRVRPEMIEQALRLASSR